MLLPDGYERPMMQTGTSSPAISSFATDTPTNRAMPLAFLVAMMTLSTEPD